MDNRKRFAGKVLVITGGGGDIGRQTARYMAGEGASIALVDIDAEKLAAAEAELASTAGGVSTYRCDVGNYSELQAAARSIEHDLGGIDLLFNNAGYQGAFEPLHRYPADDFEAVIRVNVLGAFNVLKAVSARMVKNRKGVIVNTASMAGVDGPPNMAAYAASKFAVIGLTRTAAKDLAPYGIRVNAISPAFMGPGYMWDRQVRLQAAAGSQYFSADPQVVERQMIGAVPMRRYGDISEIPGTVAFLMSDAASYITGANIPISGGI